MPVTLMRHPAVDLSMQRCIGQTDIDLSAEGKSSLGFLAEQACSLGPDQIISSDLQRCRLLAEEIARRLNIRPVFDPIWREINFGTWENRSWEEIRVEEAEAFADWVTDFVRVAPPGGESFAQLHERFLVAISRIGRAGANILVVTHAGIMRAANATFSKIPLHRAFEYQISYGGILHCAEKPA